VLHLELAIPEPYQASYVPGDCIGIPCANDVIRVDNLIDLLDLDPSLERVSIPSFLNHLTIPSE
jgi:sulfite reductase alpha subunit-like flavoprotein